MVGYYRHFIRGLQAAAYTKHREFVWNNEIQAAFEELKKKPISAPVSHVQIWTSRYY